MHLAVLQDSLKHPATPIRGFPLAVSFGLKSWALSKVQLLWNNEVYVQVSWQLLAQNISAGVVLSLGSKLTHNTSSREVFGMK